ncbi:hypothetical protein KAU08_06965 [bacterium]|nr:hypothetical protein [bacterium]
MIIPACQKRVLALECELNAIKRRLIRIYRQIRFNPDSSGKVSNGNGENPPNARCSRCCPDTLISSTSAGKA